MEHFPHVFERWTARNPDQFATMTSELMEVFSFLRANGVIHFDAHHGNIVTDGGRPYLTDFGLTLDRAFDLSDEERAFYRRNTYFDYGLYLCGIGMRFTAAYRSLGPRKKARLHHEHGVDADASEPELLGALMDNMDALYADGAMDLGEPFVEAAHRHRDIIEMMFAWIEGLRGDPRKDSTYSHARLKRLLAARGLPA